MQHHINFRCTAWEIYSMHVVAYTTKESKRVDIHICLADLLGLCLKLTQLCKSTILQYDFFLKNVNCVLTLCLHLVGVQSCLVERWQKEGGQAGSSEEGEREGEREGDAALLSGSPQTHRLNVQVRRVTWVSITASSWQTLIFCSNVFLLHKVTGDTSHPTHMHACSCECMWIVTHEGAFVQPNTLTWLLNKSCCSLGNEWGKTWNGPRWHRETSLLLLPRGHSSKVPETGWLANYRHVFLTVLGARSQRSRCQQV